MSQLPVDIYVRVSRIGKRENLISPDEQIARAKQLAQEQGLKIGVILPHDLDESGGKLNRPGLQEGLRRIEDGASGGIIVAWLDRLSRDSEHAQGLVRRMEERGARIYAPDAPSDWTTPEGQLQGGIIFLFAQYLRSRATAGFERAKAQAIENGVPINSRAAVGYVKGKPGEKPKDGEKKDRRLHPDPEIAPHVLEAFKMRVLGAGPTAIARYLESNGVKTSQGSSTWSKPAVMELLTNRVYLGELSYGVDRRYVNEAAHESLVPRDIWEAAQAPKRPRLEPTNEKKGPAYVLTSLLRCMGCGYSMQGTVTSRGKRIYRCTRRHAGGICPAPSWVLVSEADEAAEAVFWQLTDNLDAAGQEETDPVDIASLEAEVELAQKLLAQWLTPAMQETMLDTPGDYAEGTRARKERLAKAQAELGHARQDVPAGVDLGGRTLRDFWAKADLATKRELLSERFDCFALSRAGEFRAYRRGSAPPGLPRRGYRRDPALAPFPDTPDGAGQFTSESLLESAGERIG